LYTHQSKNARLSVADTDIGTADALYLDLLKKCLTRYAFAEKFRRLTPRQTIRRAVYAPIRNVLALVDLELVRRVRVDHARRAEGSDKPTDAETMIGLRRLDNLQHCITDVLSRGVPGDLIETGVWRGGATIFMRAVLKVYSDTERIVWVADSFQGLPDPDPRRYPEDRDRNYWVEGGLGPEILAVSLEQVRDNFARYGLLDNQVRFLAGWFQETLPTAPIDRLAILRLDGDMYQSTMDALRYLYPKLSVGGYAIIDDYGVVPACRAATDDFRAENRIQEELHQVDQAGVFWQRLG
jgi:O-methyltransferase